VNEGGNTQPGPDAEGDGAGDLGAPLTDDELTQLALSADLTEPLGDDAVPMHVHLARFAATPLPLWYMPPAMARSAGARWRLPVVVAVVGAFLLIEALGLCNTYGTLGWA
jgi:hypothetical protein